MNKRFVQFLTDWLVRHPHVLLVGHLAILHALAFGGWQVAAVRLLWPVAVGLLLLWQPFVKGEQQLGRGQGALLLGVVLLFAWFMNPWLLLVWSGALAAAIGGRVFWSLGRLERIGYLCAFGYVVGLMVVGVVPEIAPGAVSLEPLPRNALRLGLLAPLPVLLFFPSRPMRRKAEDAFDFFYAVLVFLLLAVFVLGSLSFMLVAKVAYIESVFRTSLALAVALLVMAWVWNPRARFSGVGSAFARYLLTIGMPLEQWLVVLNEESEREARPEAFLEAAMARLADLPWVVGGAWRAGESRGSFGEQSEHTHALERGTLTLSLNFRHAPSPAMRWHFEWLLRLAAEHFIVKQQARDLQRIGYLEAVYETGARVTHDVKNLLQSMQVLCFAAAEARKEGESPEALAHLLERQLPLLAERLKATLDKLQRPATGGRRQLPASEWWAAIRQRYVGVELHWESELDDDASQAVPADLFDSVAENLLQNALAKRQREAGIDITVRLLAGERPGLRLTDNGTALPAPVAAAIFHAPVSSEDGLGIGLYHAARQAEAEGYLLSLESNQLGRVIFSLSAR